MYTAPLLDRNWLLLCAHTLNGQLSWTVELSDLPWTQSVPAQLEQVLNLEFGVLPGIRHRERDISKEVLVGGAQSGFSGTLHLVPGVDSFAVFFWPSGWSQLFNVPVREITNHFDDATLIHGAEMRTLWNRMGEEATFARRAKIMEEFLLNRLASAMPRGKITLAAEFLFMSHGAVSIPKLGRQGAVSLRQFERLFRTSVGMSPKHFARIARFQSALDAKITNPARTWLDIARIASDITTRCTWSMTLDSSAAINLPKFSPKWVMSGPRP